jgi:Bacterial Ig-like domain
MIDSSIKNRIISIGAIALIICAMCAGCAGIVPPAGGPVDTVPPVVIRTYPPQNATNVHTEKIAIEFSEYVEQSSVTEAIFISPRIGGLEYSWSGTEVDISFSDTLRSNTTYVITIGTDVKDINNQNRMAQAYTLAFSTGDSIDQGTIAGKVFDAKPEGILIFAYHLDVIQTDTLNPIHTHPDFVTQTGKEGVFALKNIPDGSYRVLAVRDELRNYLYDPGMDEVGVGFKNIRLADQNRSISNVLFQMIKEDTAHISLLSAQSKDQRHIALRFNKSVYPPGVRSGQFYLIDTVLHDSVRVLDWYAQPQQRSVLTLVTDTLKSKAVYEVNVLTMALESGDSLMAPQRGIFFEASDVRDTIRPKLQLIPEDSARSVPFSQSIGMQFDDAVRRDMLEDGFALLDSTGVWVKGSFNWIHSASVQYRPAQPLRSAEWYTVRLRGKSAMDHAGNMMRDSLVKRRFRTIDARQLSTISGTVTDSTFGKGEIVVTATEAGETTPAKYSAVAETTGRFMILNLPEGRYILQTFRDRDNTRVYSHGKAYPYMPAAPFAVYPDTLKMRARWPIEGVRIQIK